MQNERDISNNKKKLLFIVIIGLFIISAYYGFNHWRDKYIANNVYQQTIDLDAKMDKLDQDALLIKEQKDNNDKIILSVSSLTKTNFMDNRAGALQTIKNLDYYPDIESNLVRYVGAMTTLVGFKTNIKPAKTELRILKYRYNQQVTKFNQQISDMTQQVADIKQQVVAIHGTNLQGLEMARLHFISHKLAKTASDLHASLIQEIMDDAMEKSETH